MLNHVSRIENSCYICKVMTVKQQIHWMMYTWYHHFFFFFIETLSDTVAPFSWWSVIKKVFHFGLSPALSVSGNQRNSPFVAQEQALDGYSHDCCSRNKIVAGKPTSLLKWKKWYHHQWMISLTKGSKATSVENNGTLIEVCNKNWYYIIVIEKYYLHVLHLTHAFSLFFQCSNCIRSIDEV